MRASVPVFVVTNSKTQHVEATLDALAPKGRAQITVRGDARMLDRLSRLSPTRAITTVADQMKKMLGI